MASEFLIQIVHKDTGKVIDWSPGLLAEKEFVEELCTRVSQKDIGITKTKAQVKAAVQESVKELLYDLKSKV